MKLSKRQTTPEAAWDMVDHSPYGVLSMTTPDGLPYGVPLNLWREGDCLYFHTALDGLKTDCLRACPQVSVTFVARQEVVPQAVTTHFASAILSGTAEEVTDQEEKVRALHALCQRYGTAPDHPAVRSHFASCLPATAIWRIRVKEITGKAYH